MTTLVECNCVCSVQYERARCCVLLSLLRLPRPATGCVCRGSRQADTLVFNAALAATVGGPAEQWPRVLALMHAAGCRPDTVTSRGRAWRGAR